MVLSFISISLAHDKHTVYALKALSRGSLHLYLSAAYNVEGEEVSL